jgi:hypothetical protein
VIINDRQLPELDLPKHRITTDTRIDLPGGDRIDEPVCSPTFCEEVDPVGVLNPQRMLVVGARSGELS